MFLFEQTVVVFSLAFVNNWNCSQLIKQNLSNNEIDVLAQANKQQAAKHDPTNFFFFRSFSLNENNKKQ